MKNLFNPLWMILAVLLCQNGFSQTFNLTWQPREDLNVLLPGSVRVFETNGTLPGGNRIRAMYTRISISDQNLRLRSVGEPRGAGFRLKTTKQVADETKAVFAVNGGFFSSSESVSLIVRDGEFAAPNIPSIARNGRTYYPTRSAFGIVNRKPDVAWIYTLGSGFTYQYPNPSPNDDTKPPQPLPSETFPAGGQIWPASQAMGGGPVLVQNGAVRLTSTEELFNDPAFVGQNPRTAIGYVDDNTVIVLAVDGRQKASAGMTLPELAQLMLELGCREAVNLDGGGSTTMVAASEVVNNPANVDGGDRNNLRANAAALVLTETAETLKKEVLVLDTDSPNYTEAGLWGNSNQSSFYGNTAARTAQAGNANKATYRFAGMLPGRYQLAAWWTVGETNATSVPYVLHRMGGRKDTVRVNQNDLGTTARWNVLGNFELAAGDYLEILGAGGSGRIVSDAIRLVTLEKFPALPVRGDVRIAVVSDLNSDLGASTYEWQVDSIMQRIPRIWRPDLVVCGGDMVAGQGVGNPAVIRNMWRGFERSILTPFQRSQTPFAFTIGNHDGSRSYQLERSLAKEYWDTAQVKTNLAFVDKGAFPYYYSFRQKDLFFVSWDASSSAITPENLNWVKAQLSSDEAKNARMRFVMGHLPMYSVAQERDGPGNILDKGDSLRTWLQQYNVTGYISGHHHAYFPGKRGKMELLNAGAAGSGPRQWLTLDRPALNTVTIMDIFYAKNAAQKDTTVYTTYEIGYRNPADMPLFDYKTLPRIIYSYNGDFVVRRDNNLSSTGSTARLSALNLEVGRPEKGTGTAQATVQGNRLVVTGTFTNLNGKVVSERTAVGLYGGRNGDAGKLVAALNVVSADGRAGSFSGQADLDTLGGIADQFAAGSLFVRIKTDSARQGEIRGQLYLPANQAPAKATVKNVNDRNVYAVRNLEAIFEISWNEAKDPEGDAVTYVYQLARDSAFQNILFQAGTGRVRNVKRTESDWYKTMGGIAAGQPAIYFHRIVATDGRNITNGDAARISFTKSDAPLEDLVEVPPPAYRYDGKLPNAPNGYGAAFDGSGKLWYADFSASGGAIYIENRDGTPAAFSPVTGAQLNGSSSNTGIGADSDGNILVSRNSRMFKINAQTGKVIADWQSPSRAGNTANTLTTPVAAADGTVYVASLWQEDFLYVLKQTADTFNLVRKITLPGRILARAFGMEADGKTVYLPNPGSAQVQKFVSLDGISYTLSETITSLAAGSSGVKVADGRKVYFAVRASGLLPSSFHYRDEATKRMWTLPLPDLGSIEARGIGVSKNADTLIYSGWNATGTHRFVRLKEGDTGQKPVSRIPTYKIRQVRRINSRGIADSTGVYCALEGIVSSQNFSLSGLDLALVDDNYGINVFRSTGNAGYTVRKGDKIRVVGALVQEYGLSRMVADSVRLLSANNPLAGSVALGKTVVDSLESMPVKLAGFKLADPAQWTKGQGYYGFHVDVNRGDTVFRLFIARESELYNTDAPQGILQISGIVSQFKPGAPYLSGYEIWPQTRQDISGPLVTSTESGFAAQFALRPNPATDYIEVVSESQRIESAEIRDLQGRPLLKASRMKNGKSVRMDVKSLPEGVYIIHLQTPFGKVAKRFVKNQ